MANGDTGQDVSGLNLMNILKALSVAPKTPQETASVDPKQLSVAPSIPARPTLDVPSLAPAEPKPRSVPPRQTPAAEDPSQKMMEMFNAILGHVPQVNVPMQRRPSDWIMGAVAPLATGLATAMSGPRYKAGRNFVAGLASTAPQGVANLLDAPMRRQVQQQEMNQQRYKTAAELLRGFGPFLRPEPLVIGTNENGNSTYMTRSEAVNKPPGVRPRQQNFSPMKGYDAEGNEREARYDAKLNRWRDTNSDEVIDGFTQPIGKVTADKDLVLDADGKTLIRLYRDSQGKLVRTERNVQVPSLMPKTIRKVDIRTVPQSDGTISLVETPIEIVETRGQETAPAQPQAAAGAKTVGASKAFPVGHRAATNYDKKKVDDARAFQVSDGVMKSLREQGTDPAKDPVAFYRQAAEAVISKASDPRASQSDRALVKPILTQINTELARQYPAERQALNAAHKQEIEKSMGMTKGSKSNAPTVEITTEQ